MFTSILYFLPFLLLLGTILTDAALLTKKQACHSFDEKYSNWLYIRNGHKCLVTVKDLTWHDAKKFCAQHPPDGFGKGRLAVVAKGAGRQYVEYLRKMGHCRHNEKSGWWVDGQKADPNKCSRLICEQTFTSWNDQDCNMDNIYSICEYEALECPSFGQSNLPENTLMTNEMTDIKNNYYHSDHIEIGCLSGFEWEDQSGGTKTVRCKNGNWTSEQGCVEAGPSEGSKSKSSGWIVPVLIGTFVLLLVAGLAVFGGIFLVRKCREQQRRPETRMCTTGKWNKTYGTKRNKATAAPSEPPTAVPDKTDNTALGTKWQSKFMMEK